MPTDIANLSIGVTTEGMDKATAGLGEMAGKAGEAEKAVGQLGDTSRDSFAATGAAVDAATEKVREFDDLLQRASVAARAANNLAAVPPIPPEPPNISGSIEAAGNAATSATKQVLLFGAAIGTVDQVAQRLIDRAVEMVKAYMAWEEAQSRLNALLQLQGPLMRRSAQDVNDLIVHLREVGTASELSLTHAADALLKFSGVTADVFDRALTASADLAAMMGTDVATAAQTVGRALENSYGVSALRRMGLITDAQVAYLQSLKDVASESQYQAEVLSVIEEKAKGAAAMIGGEGLSGAWSQMTNEIAHDAIAVTEWVLKALDVETFVRNITTALETYREKGVLGWLFVGKEYDLAVKAAALLDRTNTAIATFLAQHPTFAKVVGAVTTGPGLQAQVAATLAGPGGPSPHDLAEKEEDVRTAQAMKDATDELNTAQTNANKTISAGVAAVAKQAAAHMTAAQNIQAQRDALAMLDPAVRAHKLEAEGFTADAEGAEAAAVKWGTAMTKTARGGVNDVKSALASMDKELLNAKIAFANISATTEEKMTPAWKKFTELISITGGAWDKMTRAQKQHEVDTAVHADRVQRDTAMLIENGNAALKAEAGVEAMSESLISQKDKYDAQSSSLIQYGKATTDSSVAALNSALAHGKLHDQLAELEKQFPGITEAWTRILTEEAKALDAAREHEQALNKEVQTSARLVDSLNEHAASLEAQAAGYGKSKAAIDAYNVSLALSALQLATQQASPDERGDAVITVTTRLNDDDGVQALLERAAAGVDLAVNTKVFGADTIYELTSIADAGVLFNVNVGLTGAEQFDALAQQAEAGGHYDLAVKLTNTEELDTIFAKVAEGQTYDIKVNANVEDTMRFNQRLDELVGHLKEGTADAHLLTATFKDHAATVGKTREEIDALRIKELDELAVAAERKALLLESNPVWAAGTVEARKYADSLKEAAGAARESAQADAADKFNKAWAGAFRDVADRAGDFFVDFYHNGASSFKKLWDDFVDWAIRAFVRIMAQKIILNITAGTSLGTAAQQAFGSTGGGGSGGGGILDYLFGNKGTTTPGWYNNLALGSWGPSLGLSAFPSALATSMVAPAAATGAYAFGAMVPFGAAPAVGMSTSAILGGGTTAATFAPAFGAGVPAMTTMGTFFAAAAPFIPLALMAIPLITSLFESEPSKVRGQFRVSPTRTGFTDEGAGVVESRYGFLGFSQEGTQYFSGQASGTFNKIISDALDAFDARFSKQQSDHFRTILQTMVFDAFEGEYTTEDFIKKYGAKITKQVVTAAFQEIDPALATAMGAFASEDVTEVVNFTNSLLVLYDVAKELTEADRALAYAQLDGTQAGADLALAYAGVYLATEELTEGHKKLVDAMLDGTKAGADLAASFAKAFKTIEDVQKSMANMRPAPTMAQRFQMATADTMPPGALPNTVAVADRAKSPRGGGGPGFWQDVEAVLAGNSPMQTFNDAARGLRGLMDAFDGSKEQTDALTAATIAYYQAGVQLVAQLKSLKQQITDMFADTAQTIRLSGMTQQQQYNYWRGEADRNRALMLAATDPAEIARYAQRSNEAINNAWNLLTPAEQERNRPAFLAYLDSISAAASTHVQDLIDTVTEAIADTIGDAGTVLERAANKISAAADTMATAAGTPLTVQVVAPPRGSGPPPVTAPAPRGTEVGP